MDKRRRREGYCTSDGSQLRRRGRPAKDLEDFGPRWYYPTAWPPSAPEASGPTTSDLPVVRSLLNLAVYPRHLDHPRVSQPIASQPRQGRTRSSWPILPVTKRQCWLAAERSMYLRRRVHVFPLVSFKIPAQWRSIPVKRLSTCRVSANALTTEHPSAPDGKPALGRSAR